MDHLTFAQLLGNYGEFVGAIAVVATLAYLAIQIRQQNAESRIASMHAISVGFREVVAQAGDMESAELLLRGSKNYDDLDESEKFFMHARMINILRVIEEAFIHHREGRLDDRYWMGFRRYLSSIISAPGTRQVWENRRHYFHDEFQDFVDNLETTEWKFD